MRATLTVASEYRYAETTVQMIIHEAGVSRVTFYERFRNKEHAFLDAVAWAVCRLKEELSGGQDPLDVLVDWAHCEPEAARCVLAELPAVKPEVYDNYVQQAVRAAGLDPIIGYMVVGAVAGILREAVCTDRSVDLEALRAFVQPYLDAAAVPA